MEHTVAPIHANANIEVRFDGLMIFTKKKRADGVMDYQAGLHTMAEDHEIRIIVSRAGETAPLKTYKYTHKEIRHHFEHLWFHTTNSDQPAALDEVSLRKMLNLKTELVGEQATLKRDVAKPILHFKNGLLKAEGSRVACTLHHYELIGKFINLMRHAFSRDQLNSKASELLNLAEDERYRPIRRESPLPKWIQLDFSLAPGDSLRLVSGDENGPSAKGEKIFEIAPQSGEKYIIGFYNLPPRHTDPSEAQSSSHQHPDVVAHHLLHYYSAFDNVSSDRRVIVEDEVVSNPLGGSHVDHHSHINQLISGVAAYPNPPCGGGGFDFP